MFFAAIDDVPTDFDVEWREDENRFSVVTPIAISDDERRRVAIITSLYPFEEKGVLMHELQFSIVSHDLESDEVFETCERDMAKGYIPEDVRPLVIPSVLGAVRALVDDVQPAAIYRVTKGTHLPPKALHKHEMITDTLHDCGYRTHQSGTDRAGREFWVLVR